jgi:hypothetical protein
MADDEEVSGESVSEIAFARGQKEVRSIYRHFRKVLLKYEVIPPSPQASPESVEDCYIDQDEFAGNSKLRLTYEVRGIIRELQSMRVETLELKVLVSKVTTKKRLEVYGILSKLDVILRVLAHQIQRAQSLLDL